MVVHYDISDWCLVMGHFHGDVWGHTTNHIKPDWCPLKLAPEKVKIFMDDWADDYNACLEDILNLKT